MVSAVIAPMSWWTTSLSWSVNWDTHMKRTIGVIAAAALLGTMVSTNALAAGRGGGGGHTGGHVGGFVGGGIAGGTLNAGARGPFLDVTRNGRLYSVPLFASSPNAL